MKIAVCYSGVVRGNYDTNISLVKSALPDADFFFSTWNTSDQPHFIHKVYDEPELHYNPATENSQGFTEAYQKWIRNKAAFREEWSHRSKQILAHANVVRDYATNYDIIVRARYDTVISKKMISDMYKLCCESYNDSLPIGFFIPRRNGNPQHELNQDNPISVVLGSERHKQYLVDHMIIHRNDMFNHNLPWKLHKCKSLMVAEYGWWQVLSEPYGNRHKCIRGYAGVEAKR